MADKFLKTLKLPGIDEPYKIPQTAEDVGARPDTWLPTAAEIGAAPAGYGLGETDSNMGKGLANVKTGWYIISGDIIEGETSYGLLFVQSRVAGGFVRQEFFIADSPYKRTRFSTNGGTTWSDWEWVNPPMNPGVEYRTTERYRGEPVYVQLIDFGDAPAAGSYKGISIPNAKIISIKGYFDSSYYHSVLPFIDPNGTVRAYFSNSGDTAQFIVLAGDYTNYNTKAIVKYAKHTG